MIQNMINTDPSQIGGSIQTLLTKCKPNDDDLDIDQVKSTLNKQFKQYVQTQSIQAQKTTDNQMDICQTNEDRDEDKSDFENQF